MELEGERPTIPKLRSRSAVRMDMNEWKVKEEWVNNWWKGKCLRDPVPRTQKGADI